MKRLVVILTVLLLIAFTVNAQVNQQIGQIGAINWQDQIIRATGIGAPNPKAPLAAQRAGALEAAKRVALRNLLETVQGMSITSETTVQNAMIESDVIRTQVSGVIRNFKIVDTRYMSTGDVEVDVEVPISGVLSNTLLPQQMGGGTPVNYGTTPAPTNQVFTGLLIDATGLNVRPAMAPKIVDESGNEVYGTGFVSRDYAVQIGVVGYEKNLNRAKTNERITNNPLIVKALRASGTNQTDVVISNSDAKKIIGASQNLNFMEQCKVMVILD